MTEIENTAPQLPNTGIPCIDMHSHFYGGGLVEFLRERTARPCLRTREDGTEVMLAMNGEFPFKPAYHDVSVGLEQMEEFGIAKRVLTFPGALCMDVLPVAEILVPLRRFNDHLASMHESTAGRISGLAGLPLADMEIAVGELHRIRRELRLPGVILPADYFETPEILRLIEPVLRAAHETRCHVMVHPGPRVGEPVLPLAPDHPQYRTSAVLLQAQISQNVLTLILSGVLDEFPGISFQVVNLGGTIPFVIERMEAIARHRNPQSPFPAQSLRKLWFDCASMGPRALEVAVELYGADRILLGSDFPIFSDNPVSTAVVPARISDGDKARILGLNAHKLLENAEGRHSV
jgi:aminocarboxymuconate-semialdehyde decarboxylase